LKTRALNWVVDDGKKLNVKKIPKISLDYYFFGPKSLLFRMVEPLIQKTNFKEKLKSTGSKLM
jgi:hypothetical protein